MNIHDASNHGDNSEDNGDQHGKNDDEKSSFLKREGLLEQDLDAISRELDSLLESPDEDSTSDIKKDQVHETTSSAHQSQIKLEEHTMGSHQNASILRHPFPPLLTFHPSPMFNYYAQFWQRPSVSPHYSSLYIPPGFPLIPDGNHSPIPFLAVPPVYHAHNRMRQWLNQIPPHLQMPTAIPAQQQGPPNHQRQSDNDQQVQRSLYAQQSQHQDQHQRDGRASASISDDTFSPWHTSSPTSLTRRSFISSLNPAPPSSKKSYLSSRSAYQSISTTPQVMQHNVQHPQTLYHSPSASSSSPPPSSSSSTSSSSSQISFYNVFNPFPEDPSSTHFEFEVNDNDNGSKRTTGDSNQTIKHNSFNELMRTEPLPVARKIIMNSVKPSPSRPKLPAKNKSPRQNRLQANCNSQRPLQQSHHYQFTNPYHRGRRPAPRAASSSSLAFSPSSCHPSPNLAHISRAAYGPTSSFGLEPLGGSSLIDIRLPAIGKRALMKEKYEGIAKEQANMLRAWEKHLLSMASETKDSANGGIDSGNIKSGNSVQGFESTSSASTKPVTQSKQLAPTSEGGSSLQLSPEDVRGWMRLNRGNLPLLWRDMGKFMYQ